MAEISGFFADNGGDREYADDFVADFISSFISNGVYNGELGATAGANMTVVFPAGRAWINGRFYHNDAPITFQLANADGVLNRKDIIVLRFDKNTRNITAKLITGSFASSPSAPAVVRDDEQYDLKPAEISIPAGTTQITQSLITDCRADESVCGFVAGVVQQLDTATLFQQFTDAFNTWFTAMKNQLSTDAAGNLQAAIDKIISGDTKTGKAVYADTSGNAAQDLDIIDGNFQVSSIGAAYDVKRAYSNSVGYPIWDVWKLFTANTNCGIARKHGPSCPGSWDYACFYWDAAMTSGGADYQLYSFIENGVKALCGYPALTISFMAKADTDGRKLRVRLSQNYGSGGSPSSHDDQSQDVVLTTSWQKYVLTFHPVSIAAKTFGTNNDDFLTVVFVQDGTLNPSTAGEIDFTQVQMDIGTVALPYRNKPFENELNSCLRYYEQSWDYGKALSGSVPSDYTSLVASSTQDFVVDDIYFEVKKRAKPTCIIYSAASATAGVFYDNSAASDSTATPGTSSSYTNTNKLHVTASGNMVSGHQYLFRWAADARY